MVQFALARRKTKFKRLSPRTSVQSLRSSTVVSVGLMLMVFSSIKLFKEPPPGLKKNKRKLDQYVSASN